MIFKGDSRFLHIRKGKCIYSNIPGNVAWQMYMIGQISYAATFNDEGRSILTNTLLRGAGTDYVEKDMLPGDILVMYTDGLAYSEAEIAEIVSGNDAEDAVKILTEGTADRNMDGTFPIKILPGMPEPVIKPGEKLTGESPRDNASVVVYPHI
jgi:serine/threonine protein phosphatase PrpC